MSYFTKKNYKQIVMKFYGDVWCGKRNKWFDFGSNPDHDMVYHVSILTKVCSL